MKTSKKKKKRTKDQPVKDIHLLYQDSVQSPDHDIPFFEKIYKKKNGRLPRLLREDFCGTAFLSTEWVRRRPENRAVGVDTNTGVLEWGRVHNIDPLGEDAARVTLLELDVREISEPKVDAVAAFNFSYFIFKKRRELLGYFRAVRSSLTPGGIFILDIFGGWEAQMEVTDKTRYDGFTYIWEQELFDPVTNFARFHIHFKLDGRGKIRKAFTYDWRMWTVPEIRDVLEDAGFDESKIYWEGIDPETEEGDGDYRAVEKAESCPGWNAFIVAW